MQTLQTYQNLGDALVKNADIQKETRLVISEPMTF
jgi:hypothetical protein